MLKEMRRKDRELSLSDTLAILNCGEYGTLATMGDDYPYAVPVNYVLLNDHIYIHGTNASGQKRENLEKHPKVCFTVVGKTEVLASQFSESYESVVVLGTATLTSSTDKQKVLEAFIDKYSPDYKENGLKYIQAAMDKVSIIELSIDHITGKARR